MFDEVNENVMVEKIRRAVLNNILSGVVAALVVSVILGVYQLVENQNQRQQEISYACDIVASSMQRMKSANNNNDRLLYLNMMMRNMERFLNYNHNSSKLSFQEREHFRRAMPFPYSITGQVVYLTSVDVLSEEIDDYFSTIYDGLNIDICKEP